MQYNEVLSNELDFEKISEEIQLRKNQGMKKDEINPFFLVFKEWKKVFKSKNLRLSLLPKKERRRIYKIYFGKFFENNKGNLNNSYLNERQSIEPGVPQKRFKDIYW